MDSSKISCEPDYKEEYYFLQKRVKELYEENEKLKQALVNVSLKLFNN